MNHFSYDYGDSYGNQTAGGDAESSWAPAEVTALPGYAPPGSISMNAAARPPAPGRTTQKSALDSHPQVQSHVQKHVSSVSTIDLSSTAALQGVLAQPAQPAPQVRDADWYSVTSQDNSLDSLAISRQKAMRKLVQDSARTRGGAEQPLWHTATMAPFETSSNFNFLTTPVPQASIAAPSAPTAIPSVHSLPLPLPGMRTPPPVNPSSRAAQSLGASLRQQEQQQSQRAKSTSQRRGTTAKPARGKRGQQVRQAVTAHHKPLHGAVSASASFDAAPPLPGATRHSSSGSGSRAKRPSPATALPGVGGGAGAVKAARAASGRRVPGVSPLAQAQHALAAPSNSAPKSAASRAKSTMTGRSSRRAQVAVAVPASPAADGEDSTAVHFEGTPSNRSVSARPSRRAKSAAKVPLHRSVMQGIAAADVAQAGSAEAAAQSIAPQFAASRRAQSVPKSISASRLQQELEAANQLSFGQDASFDFSAPAALNHIGHSANFPTHLEDYQVLEEVKRGRVFCGLLSCGKNAQGRSGSVFVPSLACSVAIPSSYAMNRALHGDLVAVKLDRGSGLGAARGGALATADASQLSQEVLQSAHSGDVLAIASALRSMASARVGTVVRILRREHTRPFVVRVAKFNSWQALPLDTRFPKFSLLQKPVEASNRLRGQLFLAFPRPERWTGVHAQCSVSIPGGIDSPLPLDTSKAHDAVLALQIEQGALVGAMADDTTTKQRQQSTEERLPWFRTVPGAQRKVALWREFCALASKHCGSWAMQWSDALARSQGSHSPAAAYRTVADRDFLLPCLQPHLSELVERSFGNAPGLHELERMQQATVIPCISMDPGGSVALDDAVSVVPLAAGQAVSSLPGASHRLFVHIADPIFVLSSAAATAGSKPKQMKVFQQLVLSAVQRACSFYTSEWGLRSHQGMVPPAVTACSSLAGGLVRPALTIVVDVNTDTHTCSLVAMGPTVVYNVAPLTYEQGQQLLDGNALQSSAAQLHTSRLQGPNNDDYSSLLVSAPALSATAKSLKLVKDSLQSRRMAPRGDASKHVTYSDLTAASIASLTSPTQDAGDGSLDAHELISEFMQTANGLAGSVLACRAADTGIFLAQPPPPIQSLHVLAAYCAHSGIPLRPEEFGFYSWPSASNAPSSTRAVENPDKDLLVTLKRIFGILMQRSQYITGSMVFDRPDVLPDLLTSSINGHLLHGSTAQPVVDSSALQELLPTDRLQSIPVAFHNCGLGYTAYTHFTSPLRKGTDLLVHAQLHVLFGTTSADMSQGVMSSGENLQQIVRHFNTMRSRQRALQQSSEDVLLRIHLQKRRTWAPMQLGSHGLLTVPAFRSAIVDLPKPVQNRQPQHTLKLQDVALMPKVTNSSLFHSRTQPTGTSSIVPMATDASDDAAWALFHVPTESHSLDNSRFEMTALAFPIPESGSFPAVSSTHAQFASSGEVTQPVAKKMSFFHLHFAHLSDKSSLSVLPNISLARTTSMCFSMTHYLADFLPALWGELLDSSIADQPKGTCHAALNVVAMFDGADGLDSWSMYRGARRAHKASAAGAGALKPQAALWIADAKELIYTSADLPARHASSVDLPLGTPAAHSVSLQPAVHLVQHPADSRRVAIPCTSGEVLLPEHSPQIKRVNTLILPPSSVQMAGRTATLLLPASSVAEPHVESHTRERLTIRPGYTAIVSIPGISWRAYAFIRDVAKRTRIIPEAPSAQSSVEVYSKSSSGLRCAALLENSVVAVSVMFMHGTPSLPDFVVDLRHHVEGPDTDLPVFAGVFGLQLQLIPTPPSQQRNLRILADMHEVAKTECQSDTAEQLIAHGISFSLQKQVSPDVVSGMASSLAMSQTCFASKGIKPLTSGGSDLLRDIVCGWKSGEGAVASFSNPACDWLLTDLLPDSVLTHELYVNNTVEALQAANASVSFDSSLLRTAGKVGIVSEAELSLLAPELNQQQKRALKEALSSQVTLLHGPPGTGKTTTASRMIFFFALSNLHCAVAAATLTQADAEARAGMDDVLVDYSAPIFANLSDDMAVAMLPRQVHFCAPSHRAVNVLGGQLWRKLPQWCLSLGVAAPEPVTDLGVADIRQALRQPRFTAPPFICSPVVSDFGGASSSAAGPAIGTGGWGAPSDSLWGAPSETPAQPLNHSAAPSAPPARDQSAFRAAERRFQAHLKHVSEEQAEVAGPDTGGSASDEWRRFRQFQAPLEELRTLTTVRVFPRHSSLRDVQRLWREAVADSLGDSEALLMERIAEQGAVPDTLAELELAACTVQGQLDTMATKPGAAPDSVPDYMSSDSQDVPSQYPRASCLHHLARDPAVCPHAVELLCVELVLRLEDARKYFHCPVKIYSAGSAYNQVPAVIAAGCGDQEALAALKDNMDTTQTFAPPNSVSLDTRHLLQRHDSASAAAENYVLSFAHVLLTTAAEAGSVRFDTATAPRQVIVDEAAFCGELECLVPVPRAAKVVFIGDHKQLPPVLAARSPALKQKLSVSLFERLVQRATMLRTQYRMHPAIAAFPSRYFYNSELTSGQGLQQKRRLAHSALPHMFTDAGQFPVRFVQVQGIERNMRRGSSRTEDSEMSQHVQLLLDTLEADASGAGAAVHSAYGRGGLGNTLPVEYYTSAAQPSAEGHVSRASMGEGGGSLVGFASAVRRAKPAGARSLAMAALRLSKASNRHSCPLAAALTSHPTSIANVEEAVVTLLTLASVLSRGDILPHQVAIVSPYRAQVALLQNLFAQTCFPVLRGSPLAKWAAKHGASSQDSTQGMAVAEPFSEHEQGGLPGRCEVVLVAGDQLAAAGLSIASVHMGQGSERDVVILSTVRSVDASRMPSTAEGALLPDQARRTLGFLAQEQLMNVAITRAREALIVVGDANTLGLHAMWGEWLSEARARNCVASDLTLRESVAPWGDK